MITLEEAQKLVPSYTDNIIWVHKGKNFTTQNIITAVMIADSESLKYDYSELAKTFTNPNPLVTLKEIYNFVKYNIQYVGDQPYKEFAQRPHNLIKTGKGDCKSYSVLVAALLRELNIKCVYRFVSYDKNTDLTHDEEIENVNFTHVYIVCTIDTQDGKKNIVIDGVPGGSFVTERPYVKKLDKMPEYGVGVKGAGDGAGTKPFFDYTSYTEGEFSLLLIKEHAKELLKHHSDDRQAKYWGQGIDIIENALYEGIHAKSFVGTNDFKRLINKASALKMPACGDVIAIQGRKGHRISDGIIPIENMSVCEPYKNQYGYWDTITNSWVNGSNLQSYDDCQRRVIAENSVKEGLNEHLEDFAARYLYNWEDEASLKDNNGVLFETKYKIADHRRLFKDIVDVSKLSPTNMRLWSELGIGQAIAKKGHGVMTPQQGIALLKEHNDLGYYDENGSKIGEPITLTVALVWCIIIAVSGSVAIAFVQALKNKEPTALGYIDKIMGRGWGAAGQDWKKNGDNGSGTNPNGGGTNPNGGGTNPPIPPILPSPPSWFQQNKQKIIIGSSVAAAGLTAGFLYKNYQNG
ncbi:MAG: hypothetical protein RLZZ628_391 [Bacteroidota bacterium]|jgi:hypothetical protein